MNKLNILKLKHILTRIQAQMVEALNKDESILVIQQLYIARQNAQASLIEAQDKLIFELNQRNITKGA